MMKDGWGRGCPASLIIICSLEWIYTPMINGSYPESEGMIIKFAILLTFVLILTGVMVNDSLMRENANKSKGTTVLSSTGWALTQGRL